MHIRKWHGTTTVVVSISTNWIEGVEDHLLGRDKSVGFQCAVYQCSGPDPSFIEILGFENISSYHIKMFNNISLKKVVH